MVSDMIETLRHFVLLIFLCAVKWKQPALKVLQVFEPKVFIFIGICLFLGGLMLSLNRNNTSGKLLESIWRFSACAFQSKKLCTKTPGHLVAVMGFVLLLYIYFGGFQSQTIVESTFHTPFKSLTEAQSLMKSNAVRVLTDEVAHLNLIRNVFFQTDPESFDRLSFGVTRNRRWITDEICSSEDTLYFGDSNYALGRIWWARSKCRLERYIYENEISFIWGCNEGVMCHPQHGSAASGTGSSLRP